MRGPQHHVSTGLFPRKDKQNRSNDHIGSTSTNKTAIISAYRCDKNVSLEGEAFVVKQSESGQGQVESVLHVNHTNTRMSIQCIAVNLAGEDRDTISFDFTCKTITLCFIHQWLYMFLYRYMSTSTMYPQLQI